MKKLWWLYFSFLLTLLLISCGQNNVTDDINHYLEEVIKKEAEFEAEGKQIYEYEVEENSIYKKLIELKPDDHEKMKDLSKNASKFVEKRETSIDEEKSIMDESKEIFEKMETKIEKVSDDEVKETMEEMIDVMDKRYHAYDKVYEQYQTSLHLTKELYEDFGDEGINPDQLYNQVEKVNDSYTKVTEANETFNKKTSEFNELKESYLTKLDEK